MTYVFKHTYVCVYMCMYTLILIYSYTYTYTYTHTHAYTQRALGSYYASTSRCDTEKNDERGTNLSPDLSVCVCVCLYIYI